MSLPLSKCHKVLISVTLTLRQDAPGVPFIRAERSLLRDWLLTNLPVQWGKTITEIEHNDDGVAVHFKDGTIAKGDILVGADGVHSVGKTLYPFLLTSSLS